MDVPEEASQVLAEKLRAFPEVYDVDDGFSLGKSQLQLTMTPEGTGLGLTTADVAGQVRASFYGAEETPATAGETMPAPSAAMLEPGE